MSGPCTDDLARLEARLKAIEAKLEGLRAVELEVITDLVDTGSTLDATRVSLVTLASPQEGKAETILTFDNKFE